MSVLLGPTTFALGAKTGVPETTPGNASSVASLATVDVATRTVPVGKKLFLDLVEFNGENIARYFVTIDASTEGTKCTYFGGDLAGEFFWGGVEYPAGTVIKLRVENFRPDVADFDGRIVGRLDDA